MATTASTPAYRSVAGLILNKDTNLGVRNVVVELFDLDGWTDPEASNGQTGVILRGATTSTTVDAPDLTSIYKIAGRIGSVITDVKGAFSFDFSSRDFNLRGKTEQRPDLFLVVLAPDEPGIDLAKRVLHFTRDVYFNSGSREAYVIRLPGALLAEKQIPLGQRDAEPVATSEDRVAAYIGRDKSDSAFNTGVAAYHAPLVVARQQARRSFRTDFVKAVSADLSTSPNIGIVVGEGDSLPDKSKLAIDNGIVRANNILTFVDPNGVANSDPTKGVPINIYLTPDDKTALKSYFDSAVNGFASIPEDKVRPLLYRTNSSDDAGTLLVHGNPLDTFCLSDSPASTCAKEHTGIPVGGEGMGHDAGTDGNAGTSSGAMTTTTTPPEISTVGNDDIPCYLARMVRDMPAPDIVTQSERAERRATQTDLADDIGKLTLPKGPAEVPATYYFNSLQIAFDHVWKQLFDETLSDLAFQADTLGQSCFGVANLVTGHLLNGGLRLDAFLAIAPVEVPPVVARHFDVSKDEYNDLSFAVREELLGIANRIATLYAPSTTTIGLGGLFSTRVTKNGPTVNEMRTIQSLTEQGDRLIDTVRHDDPYTLHKTLRDLHARLSGSYEFTVFAADKDHHSVNFGLMTTYQQDWTPLAIQAGKLVQTMPLSPKEERKYSIKRHRAEKRSSKEAKKNNTSFNTEQSSTGRVEAEIIAKATTKTTFGLNTEGDYDIGVSSGKATSTFGVEANAESAQTRKDFREAVLKAVQEYKEEVSIEVTSESDFTRDDEESGTISNPNDELAVTYLFYELQKRYRLSEQLYRVMPVVMVAQQVPSPDQITPAWVLSNDWILRRFLLDDSFRPTLAYLANNSVGDDFSLRELRKNLRQQRNLVETLRIEFSSASVEADNRYKALETAISTRIDEEHGERTDGLVSDIGDFFGGGGQDPEAAKARELAAQDAHQYAVDKAEKISAALRQEVSTLHGLTEAYNKAMQSRLDNETRVQRLLVHLRNNILYYMQAIWSLEPPDQRYLRLHKVQVPDLQSDGRSYKVAVGTEPDIFAPFRTEGTEKHRGYVRGKVKLGEPKQLVQIADLDSPQGYIGNYIVFPMKQHNAVTEFMAAPYVDDAFGAMDPDTLANVTLDQYSKYVCCLHEKMKDTEFEAIKPQLRDWLEELLASPLRNGDEIVVPSGGLFIESLVDPNPILEDFKLKHRELDVYKVQEEVRHAGLENLRLVSRLLNAERSDPDIDKKIVVEGGGVTPGLDVDNP